MVLAVLLGVYVLYTRLDSTPLIATGVTESLPGPVAETRTAAEAKVGTIAGVGVRRVEQTRFFHTNERNEIDREFGFEQLLHEEGDQWEITHPYMVLILPSFRCRVTADRGKVQLDMAFGRPMPSDATFSGNVVIHVIPDEPNDPRECFIHLDDVGFLAARSLFSSSGAVRFLSRSAQLTGSGLELLYDEARSRVELFRVFKLDSLRLRSSEFGSMTSVASQPRPAAAAPSTSFVGPDGAPAPTQPDPDGTPADYYQCVFRGNVTITTPDRVVVAHDLLSLNKILWSGSKTSDRAAGDAPDPNKPPVAPYRVPDALDTRASSHLALDSIPEHLFDVVVTCDGGFTVAPAGAASKPAPDPAASAPASVDLSDRQHVVARRIDFDAFTNNTVLAGPVEMLFHVDPNSLTGDPAGGAPMPMTVTAQEAVRFIAASNQILLEGGCTVVLERSEPNISHEYTLTAPRLTLDLVADPNSTREFAVSVRRFLADGGPVALVTVRRQVDKLLGWTRLRASQLQYTADSQEFTAVGPGEIWLHSAEPVGAKTDPNQFGLGQPCYARLMNFDVLTYSASVNRIVAEDDDRQLLLDYFPLINGNYGRHTQVVAGHVEVLLTEIADGSLELASLTASQGIEYDDKQRYHFVGSTLVYDHAQGLVTVRGDDVLPCRLNSALVDGIVMNLKTGRLEAEVPTASVLQIRR